MGPPSFVALIPARLASTRLPDKPLADIGGRPMVVRVAERAAASGARLVAVATDSERVAASVRAAGFAVVITRSDHASGTDRLAEASAILGLDESEIVVNVQGDEPLVPPALICAVASCLARSADCAIATAAHPIASEHEFLNPNIVKVVADAAGRALYFSRAPIPHARDAVTFASPVLAPPAGGTAPPTAVAATLARHGLPMRHVGLYAYRAGFLARFPSLTPAPLELIESLEQLRAMWHGHRIAVHVTELEPPAGVDTPADLERVRAIWSVREPVGQKNRPVQN